MISLFFVLIQTRQLDYFILSKDKNVLVSKCIISWKRLFNGEQNTFGYFFFKNTILYKLSPHFRQFGATLVFPQNTLSITTFQYSQKITLYIIVTPNTIPYFHSGSSVVPKSVC